MCRVVVMSRPVSFRAVSDCMGRRGLQRVLKMVIQKVIQTTRAQQPKR